MNQYDPNSPEHLKDMQERADALGFFVSLREDENGWKFAKLIRDGNPIGIGSYRDLVIFMMGMKFERSYAEGKRTPIYNVT